MSLLLIFLLASCTSLALTGLLRRYALENSLMDIPNERSSHSIPTPRGGGVAIIVAFLVGIIMLRLMSLLNDDTFIALSGSGISVAIIGFMDDHGHIAARWRLLSHFSAAGWVVFWLGGLPPLTLFGLGFDLSWIGHVLAAFYLVWLLNLYNFMDGIDGIASIEAITVCLGGALLYYIVEDAASALLPLLLAAAVIGFLFWNFPPAKIFMGDAGSGFLGIILGGLSLQAAWLEPDLLWGWLILMGVFIVDATYTLIRRLVRGDKVYEAHRSHAYQYASRCYGRHRPVTLGVLIINLCWLLPLACLPAVGILDGALALVIAYIPLVGLAVYFHAGELECEVNSGKKSVL